MSEASQAENQTATSPARQMLAALTQASKEMTTKFNEISDRAAKLNVALDNDVSKSLAEVNHLSEIIVRVQLEGLSAEKDAVLAELTILRQEELKVLQTIARKLRDALTQKVDELLSGLKTEVKEQLDVFQKNIGQKETEVIQTEKDLRKALREKLPEQLALIQKRVGTEKTDLESLQFRQQGLLAQETKLSLEKLREHGTELKGRLAREQSKYLESVELAVRELVQAQAEKLDKRIQDFSTMHEKARPQIQAEMEFLNEVPESFSESCKQVAELRVRMHDSRVKNLALVYGAEIRSIAQDTEDKLVVVRSQLQSLLRHYYDYYLEQSSLLLTKYEKDAAAAKPVPTESEKPPQEEEIPTELFDKLRKEIRKITRDLVSSADTEMEQSFAEFRTRLASGSQDACSMVESSFHDCRKKVVELAELQKEELEELNQKGNALEQLVDEAKELIGAMNPSNLEF